jgi:hypothetical protein
MALPDGQVRHLHIIIFAAKDPFTALQDLGCCRPGANHTIISYNAGVVKYLQRDE